MGRQRSQVWFEPIWFRIPRAFAELRVAASQVNWVRVLILCALCAGAVAELVRRYLPEADISWAIFLLRGVGVLALGATLTVLVVMISRFVQLAKHGIVVQHGQSARIYAHSSISNARVESSGSWMVIRFGYRGRDIEVGPAKNVHIDDVAQYLLEHQLDGTREASNPTGGKAQSSHWSDGGALGLIRAFGRRPLLCKIARTLVAAAAVAAIVALHPAIIYGSDHFVLSEDGFKVFSYGFPFRIVDCSDHLPFHMSGFQQAIRLTANFAITFLVVVLAIRAYRNCWPQCVCEHPFHDKG